MSEEEWRALGDDRVLSCSLKQIWVRHRCVSRRPFQVQSVTQCEAVVPVIMATGPTAEQSSEHTAAVPVVLCKVLNID